MSSTKTKRGETTRKPSGDSPDAQLRANADELGALDRELTPYEPKIARREALRKAIRAHYADAAAEQPFIAEGDRFVVHVGPRAQERSIDYVRLWKLTSVNVMRKIATVTLKALEAAVTCQTFEAVVSSAATGTRSLKIFEKGATS